jgi:hypothetical protein
MLDYHCAKYMHFIFNITVLIIRIHCEIRSVSINADSRCKACAPARKGNIHFMNKESSIDRILLCTLRRTHHPPHIGYMCQGGGD